MTEPTRIRGVLVQPHRNGTVPKIDPGTVRRLDSEEREELVDIAFAEDLDLVELDRIERAVQETL